MTKSIEWIEVWIDSASLEYFLVVQKMVNGTLNIIDVMNKATIIFTSDNYSDVVHWLREDEYDLIEGRYKDEWVDDTSA